MADRCEDCSTRLDGLTPHADDCPQRAPELREKLSEAQTTIENMKEILQRYSDRCPCRPGSACPECKDASDYL